MNSKLASLAQVYLLSSMATENTFLIRRGPIYLKLLNCDEIPGPPPKETISGQFFSSWTVAPILPKNMKPSADPFFKSTFKQPLLMTPLYLYSDMLGVRHMVSILQIPAVRLFSSGSVSGVQDELTMTISNNSRGQLLLTIVFTMMIDYQTDIIPFAFSLNLTLYQTQEQQLPTPIMKIRKCSQGTSNSDLEQFALETKNQATSKIIKSYEELLHSLNTKIGQLTIDLQLTHEKLQITETRYATLLQFVEEDKRINIEKLVDKVDELEKKFINQNAEIVRLKGRLLKDENGLPEKQLEGDRERTGIERVELANYFNFERIRQNQDIMKRQRRNSAQEQENSLPWEKALEQFADHISSPTKFKQKTQGYLKKFIPHEQRHKIWPFIFENQLGITNSLYIELLDRRSKHEIEPHVKSQIHRDIMRSFSNKMDILFNNNSQGLHANNKEVLSAEVQEILEIFHLLRPDISYVQGMTYPVIILTIVVGKIEAFKIFSNLVLCNKFFRNMYSFQDKSIEIYCKVFDVLLKQSQPQIFRHLQTLQIKSQLFLIEWFFTIFSRGLSLETTLKIWDLLGYQKEVTLYRIGLSIFELIGKRLLVEKYEETIGLIQSYWACIDENKLLELIVNSKLGNDKLGKVYIKVSREVHHLGKTKD